MKRYYAMVYGLCDAVDPAHKERRAAAQAAVAAERAKGPPSEEEVKRTYKGLGQK